MLTINDVPTSSGELLAAAVSLLCRAEPALDPTGELAVSLWPWPEVATTGDHLADALHLIVAEMDRRS